MIELLAVIAIILLLSGIILTAVGYAHTKASRDACRTWIQAIDGALESYKLDNGGYPPLDALAFSGLTNGGSPSGFIWDFFPNGSRYYGDVSRETVLWIGTTDFGWAGAGDMTKNLPTNGWGNSQFIYRALATGPKVYMNFSSNQLQLTQRQPFPNNIFCNIATNCGMWVTGVWYNGRGTWVIVDSWGMPLGYNPLSPRANPGRFDLWSAGPDQISSNAFYWDNIWYPAPGWDLDYGKNGDQWSGGPGYSDDDIGNWPKSN